MAWAAAAMPAAQGAMTALQAVQAVDALAGPRGALATGDLSQGISAGSKLMSGVEALGVGNMGSTAAAKALGIGSNAKDTIESALGISKLQFDALDPFTKEALLRKVLGR